MNLQENIHRIKQVMGVINESQYSNNLKRRVHILDSLIDNLLPNMYPCDYNDEDDFFTGVYHELHHLIEDEQYGLENLDRRDMIEYIYENKQDEIREYYRERCNKIQEGLNDKWTRGENTVTLKQLLKITKDIPVTKMSTKKLMKHALHGDNPEEMKKVDKTSLKYPVLVLVSDNGLIKYILDGHHRIQKANKHDMKMVNVKLIKFSELPKEFKKVLGEEKEEQTEGELTEKCWKGYTQKGMKTMFGKRYPNCVKIKETVKPIDEQAESKKDALKSMLQQSGIEVTSKLMGGIDNLINVLYDGDVMKFSEDTHTPLAYMSVDEMSLYIHQALVDKLGLENANFSSREKTLGKFRFGSKNSHLYAFTANLTPTRLHDQPYYKVVGTSGDSGFGYAFINKRNTLGKRYRQQIFKQIIDKYNLEPYMQLKTFY
jgi:hypothetical protein